MLTAARVGQRAVVRLNLFDDVVLDAVVHRTGPTSAGYWLAGHIGGSPPGSLILVVNDELVAGTVLAPSGSYYSIRAAGDGDVLAIQQIDLSALMEMAVRAESLIPALRPGSRPSDRVAPPSSHADRIEDGSWIDVLVVYDAEARMWFGGHAEIKAQIDLAIAGINESFFASGVIPQLYLTSAQEAVLDDDDVPETLGRLRDRFAADIGITVAVGGCGSAAITLYESLDGGELRTYPHRAWASVSPACLNPFIAAHEVGHVMGLWHDRYVVQKYGDFTTNDNCLLPCTNPSVSYKPYSYGYVNQRAFDTGAPYRAAWRTIMSYPDQCNDSHLGWSCHWVFRFSNPDQMYTGDPMGVAGDERSSSLTGPVDAVRSLNDARHIIANYRVRPPGTNRPPVAVGTLPDRGLSLDGTLDVDVTQAFDDPDGDPLTYTVASSETAVVTVRAAGARVMLTAVGEGAAAIRVTATDPGRLSATQSFRATVGTLPAPFTDDPIRAGVTPIRTVHFTELRMRIAALRAAVGLAPFRWMDPTLRAGVTRVRLAHLLELREALGAVYSTTGRPVPRWTDAVPAAGSIPIRAAHVTELRAAVVALE